MLKWEQVLLEDDDISEEDSDFSSILDPNELMQDETKREDYPDRLPILPLTKRPFPPSMTVPLIVEKGVYYDLMEK